MSTRRSYNAIFVFWSAPMFSSDLRGYNKDRNEYTESLFLHDYEIQIQKLSALSAKKHIGKTILYTDYVGLVYLKSIGLDSYYDEINTDLLTEFNKQKFNKGYFWTSGKTYVICKQENPFIFLDLDFVIKEKIPNEFKSCDLVHNQWELQRGKFYISKDKLKNINLPYHYNGMLMPNTSFLLVNTVSLLKEYWKLHQYLLDKYGNTKVDESIWLLADQGILAFVIRKFNLDVYTIEKYVYIEDGELKDSKILKYGGVPQYVDFKLDNFKKIDYYHMWLDKAYVHSNSGVKKMFMDKINKELLEFENKKIL